MRTALIVVLVPLIFSLAAALLAAVLRPRHKDDAMLRAIGDAPGHLPGRYWPRGGYAAMDETWRAGKFEQQVGRANR